MRARADRRHSISGDGSFWERLLLSFPDSKESRNSVMADITRIRIASGRWMAGRLSLDWLELWFCFDRRHRSFGLLKLNVIMQALMARH